MKMNKEEGSPSAEGQSLLLYSLYHGNYGYSKIGFRNFGYCIDSFHY